MGRQVNFYMTEDDEQKFLRFLRSDREVGIFMDAVPSPDIPLLEVLPGKETPGWFALWLWDMDNSPHPKMVYVPQQKYYAVDSWVSEVIEFSRSCMHVEEGGLVRGRIWAEIAYWDLSQNPPRRVTKTESFRKWFNRLASWIRHKSVKDSLGDCLLPGAAEYAKNGGRLCQALFAPNVKIFRHELG